MRGGSHTSVFPPSPTLHCAPSAFTLRVCYEGENLPSARVTEAAALAGYKWLERGDKIRGRRGGQRHAYHAQRVNIDGTIVIGEGEIDSRPRCSAIGESRYRLTAMPVDIAVDRNEGTRMTAAEWSGEHNALAVLAVGIKGCFTECARYVYGKTDYCRSEPKGRSSVTRWRITCATSRMRWVNTSGDRP